MFKPSNFESTLYLHLKKCGFILPVTEDDLNSFEDINKELEIPELPSLDEILKLEYSTTKINIASTPNFDSQMSMAARNGASSGLSQEILDKMKHDRERDRKKE